MKRRVAREIAVQTLFLLDFNKEADKTEALEAVFAERENLSGTSKEYARFLVEGVKNHLSDIDKYLSGISKEWALERMPGVDRNIVRLAIFEMKYSSEPMDAGIAINEAVEIAKTFGTENSSRFINGVLGSTVKNKKTEEIAPD